MRIRKNQLTHHLRIFFTLETVKNEYSDGTYTLIHDDNPTADATTLVVDCVLT